MATYWITYRLQKDGGYDTRYNLLITAAGELADGKWWVEPTSFILFSSQLDIDAVAQHIRHALDEAVDMALVGMTEYQDARVIGDIRDPDLFAFMPFAKKV